jgi:chromosomal replication initiator protein
MPDFTLDAWIHPLVARVEKDRVVLSCPTAFHRERVRERFLTPIERCIEAESGRAMAVELALARPERVASRAKPKPCAAARKPRRTTTALPTGPEPAPQQIELPYRFDNFVVGPCNALAREASVAVAQGRQRGLNPLFIWSREHGRGRTHLARAIIAEASGRGTRRVIYSSAESFTNDFMASIRSRQMERFKRRYRDGCDLLVVEDVQFLDSKKQTQLEIFHTLAHLIDVGARVVLTADRLPRDIGGVDRRLRAHMSAGLVAELEAPDATIRRQILRSKAAAGGVRVPEDCLDLLVESIRGNVRDLESVLIQLVASASLLKRPIDLELTRAALQKVAPPVAQEPGLDVMTVVGVVAGFFRKRPEALASRSRRRDVLVPRQLAMYLCRRYTDAPLSAIGRALGREHPAVRNAIEVVERGILEHAPLRYQVETLCSRLDALEAERRAPG